METLREWAEYYQRLKIWVYPYDMADSQWIFWRNKKDNDYYNISKSFRWEEVSSIKMVVGKKGIRILELHEEIFGKDPEKFLGEALSLLGLQEDYSWVIESKKSLSIVIDTPNDNKKINNYSYGGLLLLTEGTYTLPPSYGIFKFYKDRVPTKHPIQISNETLMQCRNILLNKKPNVISFKEDKQEDRWYQSILSFFNKLIRKRNNN